MKLAGITRMARSADPKHPSVRVALIGVLAAGIVGVVYDYVVNDSFDIFDSLSVSVAAFLGWAIAREIDPDHQTTALLALAGSAFLAIWLLPYLLLSAVALGALRLLVGTVGGGGPTRLDLAVMVLAAGYSGWYRDGWFLAVIVMVGILISGGRENIAWAIAAAAASGAVAFFRQPSTESLSDVVYAFFAFPLLLIAVVVLALPVSPTSTTDIKKQLIDPRRLRLGRILAGLAVVSALFASDVYGLTNLGPLTAAVVSAALAVPFTRPKPPMV